MAADFVAAAMHDHDSTATSSLLACAWLLSCKQVVMNGNQVPKSVEITQEAINTGAEVRQQQQHICNRGSGLISWQQLQSQLTDAQSSRGAAVCAYKKNITAAPARV
jgi:hypothetical protein